MAKYLLCIFFLILLSPLSNSETYSADELINKQQWRAFPFDNSKFRLTRKTLKQSWPYFHRATPYPYPEARNISKLLKSNPALKDAIPNYKSVNQVSKTLQGAWIAFYEGHFQKAAQLGYSLGPIGHCVAFIAQNSYASRLESSKEIRHALWEDIIDRHELHKNVTSYNTLTRFMAFVAMARLSAELRAPLPITRGYLSQMQQELAELNAIDPNNTYVLAAQGSMDAGIVRKLGKLMGRLAFGASPELVDAKYQKAIAADQKLPSMHVEYAQSMLYMHGKKRLKQALAHMRIASNVEPRSAIESLEIHHAKKLLAELEVIEKKKGYGLRAYIKRNTDMEKKYYL